MSQKVAEVGPGIAATCSAPVAALLERPRVAGVKRHCLLAIYSRFCKRRLGRPIDASGVMSLALRAERREHRPALLRWAVETANETG